MTYDVATDTPEGRQRIRRVAKVCEGYGQRVQKSVFECVVNAGQLEQLRHLLRREVNEREDSLRIYRLLEPRERYVETIGAQMDFDIRDPLVM